MNKKITLGIASLIGLSAMALTTSAAGARPVGPYAAEYRSAGPVVQVDYYRRGYGRGSRHYGHGPRYYGPRGGYYYNNGPSVALGVLGGLAVGGAIASGAAPYYYDEPECRLVRREEWVPGWGYRIRRVEICD